MGKKRKGIFKKNALIKEFFRELNLSKTRFISIVLIVALGAGFYAGIKASGMDMRITSNRYLKDSNYMDMSITSNYGMAQEDIDAIQKVDGVRKVVAEYQSDFLLDTENVVVLRAHSYDDTDENTLNKFKLISGRLPENPGECLIEDLRGDFSEDVKDDLAIGSTIRLKTGAEDAVSDFLKRDSYTVVGTVTSPLYVTINRGASLIGAGSMDHFMYLPSTEFTMEAFAWARVSFNSTTNLIETFSDEYKSVLVQEEQKITTLSDERQELRYNEIIKEPLDEIVDAENELKKEKDKVTLELADAKSELDDAGELLSEGEKEYLDGKTAFEEGISKAENELKKSKVKLENGRKKYEEGFEKYQLSLKEYQKGKKLFDEEKIVASKEFAKAEAEILLGEQKLEEAKKQLDSLKAAIDAGLVSGEEVIAQYEAGLAEYNKGVAEIKLSKQYVESGKIKLTMAEKELDDALKQLNDAKKQLDSAKAEISAGQILYDKGIATFEQEKADGLKKLVDGKNELSIAKTKYDDGKKEYENGVADFEAEIAKAQKAIDNGRIELGKLEKVEWATTLRHEFSDVSEFNDNAGRIDSISTVFPVFFLLIAGLVCLTTMTRMVESERTQIGTLKALGYSNAFIALKYIAYALIASLLGSLLGVAIGYQVFPRIIYGAYTSLLFRLPPVIAPFHIGLTIPVVLVSIVTMVVVTIFTCYKSLRSMPARLLRPPAPKVGKRIFLERITPIWNLFNFSWKVTLRNLFRYKRRMFMTLVGIAGCTGLMLAGFGLRDSISGIVDMQFNKIVEYNTTAIIDADNENLAGLVDKVKEIDGVEDAMITAYAGGTALNGDKKYDIAFVITDDAEHLKSFVNMAERLSGDAVELGNNGVIITEKLAKLLGVSVGETAQFEKGGKVVEATVSGIIENYAFHYAYMQSEYFESIFNEKLPQNQVLININDDMIDKDENLISNISQHIMDIDGVMTVSSTNDMSEGLNDQMSSLNTVIFVLVFCAGVLAFIVMYNLTNINIIEREREVATIKVLGFYDKETNSYIYRESILLSIIGAFIGFVFGAFLTKFVVNSAEVDQMMFGRDIHLPSFIFAFALTLLFTFIVKIFINKRIKSIDMIEALKSVD